LCRPRQRESYAAAFAKSRNVTSHVIAGADHRLSLGGRRNEYTSRVVQWFGALIEAAPEPNPIQQA
jgi:hypothetical protein